MFKKKKTEPKKKAAAKTEAPMMTEDQPAVEAQPEFVPPRKGVEVQVEPAKTVTELPPLNPREKYFECPYGCLKVGPADRGEDWCAKHGIKINPKRVTP